MSRAAWCALILALLVAEAPSAGAQPVRLREPAPAEHRLVVRGLLPLMADLGYPVEPAGEGGLRLLTNCGIRLAVVTRNHIQAAVLAGTESPCTHMTLLITEGTLTRLPLPELQALLAHELAHVHLRHMDAFGALAIAPATLTGLQFSRDQESEADRFAALMLKRTGGEDACLGLVAVLMRVASESPASATDARSTHPNLPARIREARRACEIL
ncbi:MAG TPA: M48 family metalloprotease [Methylomirabilota bacterium]|nr:M48 family metalloprotease [Methylomirabilota bacterium]